MAEGSGHLPFGERLNTLLEQQGYSQAWLAERTGLERSTISRLIKGDRNPSADSLQHISAVLQIEIQELVRGTDAEEKVTEAADLVRRVDYDAAIQRMLDCETRNKDLELELRSARQAQDHEKEARIKAQDAEHEVRAKAVADLGALQYKLEISQSDLAKERQRCTELKKQLLDYRRALQQAVGDVASLRAQLTDLSKEVKVASSSSRTAAILAAVAAFAGVVTAATYLEKTSKKNSHPPDKDERSNQT